MRYTAFTKDHQPLFSADDSAKIGDMCIDSLRQNERPAVRYVYDSISPPISYYRYTVWTLNTDGGIVAGEGHQFYDLAEVENFYYQREN